ncbi:hypothetical protein BRC70_04625 [Halobacteriales archaeon QH_6_68_27]|nr:MAG: hypothetical protein BRC70_04625 [Halobacteriales archaeon QH_6_68_27]
MTDHNRGITALSLSVLLVASVVVPTVALSGVAAAANHNTIDGCTTIEESGTYELSGDIDAEDPDCIEVSASDVTIQGNDNTVEYDGSSSGGQGVFVTPGQSNVTVTDLTATNWSTGVRVGPFEGPDSVEDVTLRNVNASYNGNFGIFIEQSADVTVTDATASGNGHGVRATESEDLGIINSELTDNSENGVSVSDSSGLTVSGSTLAANDVAGLLVVGSTDVTVTGTVLRDNLAGAGVSGSQTVQVESVEVTDNGAFGLGFGDSSDVTVTDAIVTGTSGAEGEDGTALLFRSTEADVRNSELRDNTGREIVSRPSEFSEEPSEGTSLEDGPVRSVGARSADASTTRFGTAGGATGPGARSVESRPTDTTAGATQEAGGAQPVVLENVRLDDAPVIAEGTVEGGSLDTISADAGELPDLPEGWVTTGDYIDADIEGGYADLSLDAPEEVPDSAASTSLRGWEFYETWRLFGNSDETASLLAENNVSDSRVMGVLGQEPPEGNFQLEGASATSPVQPGETVEVTSTVTNVAEGYGTQEVTLSVDGTEVDATTLTLEPGESRELTFQWETTAEDAGEHDLTVATANDTAETTATVESAGTANYSVDIVAADSVVDAGDSAAVAANVTNVGEHAGEQTVTLNSEGTAFDATPLALEPGESREVTLDLRTSDEASGEFELVVASDNDTDTTPLRVRGDDGGESESTPTDTPTPTPTPSPTDTPAQGTATVTPTDTPTSTPTPTVTPTPTPTPTDTATPVPAETTAPTAAEDVATDTPEDEGGFPWWLLLVLLAVAAAVGIGAYARYRQQQ